MSECGAREFGIRCTEDLDLSCLQSITLGKRSLFGDSSDNRKATKKSPFDYKNTFTMKSGDNGAR